MDRCDNVDQAADQSDRITLKGLAFYGHHGVSPHEKALGTAIYPGRYDGV